MFDSPIAGQYMNTYAKLPFKEIAYMGDKLRKVSDKAAEDAEGLRDILASVKAIDEDKARKQERIGELDKEFEAIYDLHRSDPYRAQEKARRLGTTIKKEIADGELGAIGTRYANKKEILDRLDKTYRSDPNSKEYDPALYNYYANKLNIEDLNWDPSTGTYGAVTGPQQVKAYSAEELNDHYSKTLKNLKSDQILSDDAPEHLKKIGFTELIKMKGAKEYISRDKVKAALLGATDQGILQSAEIYGIARGQGAGQGNILNKDGSFNTDTDLGRQLEGLTSAASFVKQKEDKVIKVKDDLGLHKAKQKYDNSYVISGSGNVVKRGATLDPDGNAITDSAGALKKINGYDTRIKELETELSKLPANDELTGQYKQQIETLKRKRTQTAKVVNDVIAKVAKEKGWKRKQYGQPGSSGAYTGWVDANGREVEIYPNYALGDMRVNSVLENDVNEALEKALGGRDITVNQYHGTGDAKLDKQYSKRLYDYAATSTMMDDNGDVYTLDKITKDMKEKEKKRLREGGVNVKFTEAPDSDYGTYGMSFTVEVEDGVNKTFYMKAPPEYGQSKIQNKDGTINNVRVSMNEASLDWSEASKLPDGGSGVKSKSGFGTYYFDSYKGTALTGAGFIFVPAKGVKTDMDGDGTLEIADGKTAISVDKDKRALTKLFMLNKQGVDYEGNAKKVDNMIAAQQQQEAKAKKQASEDKAKSTKSYQPYTPKQGEDAEDIRDNEYSHAFNQLTSAEQDELGEMLGTKSGTKSDLYKKIESMKSAEEQHKAYMKLFKDLIAKRGT